MGYLLRVVGGPLDGHVIPVPEERPITLGRGSNNDVQLHDKKLSRTHCQLAVVRGACVITDLNSTNGTYVGGEKVEERTLVPGDIITIGTTTLKAAYREVEAEATAAAPAARCAECGRPIGQGALDSGAAKLVGDRAYCEECRTAALSAAGTEEAERGEEMPVELDVDLAPGERFAGYTIAERLRSTLYGAQFRATKKELGNPVMLTLLRTGDADWANKFLHACYQAGTMIHPAILLLCETGDEQGRFFYATEFVAAQTLDELIAAAGSLSAKESLAMVDQIAHALTYAFEKHILHGTLSGCNVYVKQDHTCKVGEFGLSTLKPLGQAAPFALPLMPFRSPEQLRQAPLPTIEGDIYALGALFYYMVTGKPPFEGKSIEEVRAKVLEGKPVPAKSLLPDLPESVTKVIERCMAYSPTGRYQTPRELINELEYAMRAGV